MKTATETAAVDIESLVAEVADRFTEEVKQGRSPSVEEYAQRHPEIAHIIRQVFPALAMLDDLFRDRAAWNPAATASRRRTTSPACSATSASSARSAAAAWASSTRPSRSRSAAASR